MVKDAAGDFAIENGISYLAIPLVSSIETQARLNCTRYKKIGTRLESSSVYGVIIVFICLASLTVRAALFRM